MTSEKHSIFLRRKQGSVAIGASATLIASIVSLGVSMLTSVLLARILGPDVKGRIDLIIASGGLTAMITGFSLTSGITFVVAQGRVNVQRLAWQLAGIAILQSVIVGSIFLGFLHTPFINAFVPKEFVSWGALGVSSLALALLLGGYGRALLAGLQQFIKGAVTDVVARVLLVIATAMALLWSKADNDQAAVVVIWAMIVANFMSAALMFGMALSNSSHQEASSQLRRVWRYSLPSYAGNLVQFANYRLDVFLVAYFIGVRDVALYGAAVSIAQLLWLPSNAMQAVLFPRVSSLADDHQRAEKTAQITRLMFVATAIGGGVVGFSAPWGIRILFGVQFASSVLPLWLILPGIVSFSIANVICGYLAGIGKPQLNFYIALLGLVATLLLDFLLIPRIGIAGAAIASSISYTISAGLSLYLFIRESHLSPVQTVVPTKDDVLLVYHTFMNILEQIFFRFSS